MKKSHSAASRDLVADRSDFRNVTARRERNAVRELKKRATRRNRAEAKREATKTA